MEDFNYFLSNYFKTGSKIGFIEVWWLAYPGNKNLVFEYSYFYNQNLDLKFFNYNWSLVESTVMQVEKALINDPLRVSKVSWKFHIPTIYNFAAIYPWSLLFP